MTEALAVDDTWARINAANLYVGWHVPTLAERDQIEAFARDLNREFFPADPRVGAAAVQITPQFDDLRLDALTCTNAHP